MRIVALCMLVVLGFFFLFPLYWIVTTSFKYHWEAYSQPPTFFPKILTLDAYRWLFAGPAFKWIKDSFIIATLSMLISMLIGTMAGYAFSRFPAYVGGDRITFWLLTTRMFPPIVVALPLYFLYSSVHLTDTYPVLIISYLTFNLPLVVWLTRSFFNSIPYSYEEAAYIEGCSLSKTFMKVTLPLVYPGLIATAALCWIFAWNEFLFALILTGQNVTPFPPLISTLAAGYTIYWNRIMTLSLFTMGIPLTVIIVFRKHLVSGLSLGILTEK